MTGRFIAFWESGDLSGNGMKTLGMGCYLKDFQYKNDTS